LYYVTVSSAEDPEKILDQAVRDMQEDLIKMRQAAAQVGSTIGIGHDKCH
jgi:phage shock protein A